MSKKNEVALVRASDRFPILAENNERQALILQRNVGDEFTPFDLDRIKIPSGGGKIFSIPTIDGEDSAKAIECIVLYKKDKRNNAYWPDEYSGSNEPPACTSNDGVSGTGIPGGSCKTCKFNQFGSDPKGGKGKACQNRQFIFVLLPGDLIPYAISLPPTSLKSLKNYTLGLSRRGLMYYEVLTEISLETVSGGGVPDYSRAVFKVAKTKEGGPAILAEDERVKIEKLIFSKGGMQSAFEAVNIQPEDMDGAEGGIE